MRESPQRDKKHICNCSLANGVRSWNMELGTVFPWYPRAYCTATQTTKCTTDGLWERLSGKLPIRCLNSRGKNITFKKRIFRALQMMLLQFFCCKINKHWRRKWEKSSQQNNMLFTLYPDARRDSKIRTYILSLENFAQEESRDFYNKIWQMCQKKNEKKGNMNIPILPFLSLLLHIATSIPSSAPCIQSNQSYGTRTWEKHEWCLFSF